MMYCQPEPTVFSPPLSTGDAWGSQDLDFSLQHPWELSYTSSIGMTFGDPWPLLSNQILAQCTLDQVVRDLRKKNLYFAFLCLCMDHLSVSESDSSCITFHVDMCACLAPVASYSHVEISPAFSHLPEAWEMHSLSSSPLYSPHGSGFVACWSMGSLSFCPFLVFSHSAARLQIHCAISVFCNPTARFPSQLPLGTYKNTFS